MKFRKITNKDRKVLGRLKRDVDPAQIDKDIENTLKLNKMDLIDPYDNTMKSSLFFRLNVSGRIESAKVTYLYFCFFAFIEKIFI